LEILLFTAVAIALYFAADWILRAIEQRRGELLPHRNIIYFVLILTLTMTTFQVLQHVLQQSGGG
jgi:TRAP-type C4-dicarboxylate transport system permease small subunit